MIKAPELMATHIKNKRCEMSSTDISNIAENLLQELL